MLVTFEPNVAQRSVASQNDHKSKACLPEAYNTAFTMYRRLFSGASTALIQDPFCHFKISNCKLISTTIMRGYFPQTSSMKMSLLPLNTLGLVHTQSFLYEINESEPENMHVSLLVL